ncbi:iron uptake system protein EfeO [Frigidibacter sp. MR17.24]|uniref:iron uptake system protein EfeO n=1 Tax=Frigidibacter sp. MR17.24 TaxID=3127345 RepID=UPI003012B77D
MPAMPTATQPATPPAFLPLLLAGSVALTVAGMGAFWYAGTRTAGPADPGATLVSVTEDSCTPSALTLPAGRARITVHNASSRPLEWEILDGVMVVAERENILPGMNATIDQALRPGRFEITCGLLSNPHGTLEVTETAASAAAAAHPPLRAFIGPLSEYRFRLARDAGRLVTATEALRAAIAAGDLGAAREAWRAARLPYKRLEPVAGRMSDLAARIDVEPRYLAQGAEDPAFAGFHRLARGLWPETGSETGAVDLAALAPVADRLGRDVAELKTRLSAVDLAPGDLADNAAQLARRLAEGQAATGGDPGAGSDRAELMAGLDGIDTAETLIDPLLAAADPQAATRIRDAAAAARAALAALPEGVDYPALPAPRRARIAAEFATLAAALETANPAIGID